MPPEKPELRIFKRIFFFLNEDGRKKWLGNKSALEIWIKKPHSILECVFSRP